MLSCVQLFANLWTVTHQGPLSMEFYKQEYWSGLLFSPPEDLPGPGIEPVSCTAGKFFTVWTTEDGVYKQKLAITTLPSNSMLVWEGRGELKKSNEMRLLGIEGKT